MASAYMALKHHLLDTEDDTNRFYKALRRMYFANVATYLCQYHDDSRLSEKELLSIDTCQEISAEVKESGIMENVRAYLRAWGSLKYNTITNDGEQYIARESYEYLQGLAERMARLAVGA
jgi:hypothetical protein